jgi:hypothetical protein
MTCRSRAAAIGHAIESLESVDEATLEVNSSMTDTQLAELSLLELQDLQAKLHVAIRKAIRDQQEAMAARYRRPPQSQTADHPAEPINLARERDAWLARKRGQA